MIIVLLCTVIYLAAAPVLHAKAQPAYGSGHLPKGELTDGMRDTMVSKLSQTQDTVDKIAHSQNRRKVDTKKAREAATKLKEKKKKAEAERKQNTVGNQASGGSAGTVDKPKDSSGGYQIMGKSSVTADQMARRFNSVAQYPVGPMAAGGAPTIDDFCEIIVEEAEAEGVKADVVFAQAMVETGWLRFGGSDSITQYNFAGLGTVGDGNPGNAFPDVETGIRAQVQHLKAYASDKPLNGDLVDQRFDVVRRMSAPIVEWLGIPDNPYGLGWAGGQGYGNKILKIISDTRSM